LTLRASVASGLLLVHGTPHSNNEGLGVWSTDDELTRHLGLVEERVLVCAHTHRPMLRELPGGLVVNVGAVGLPFNRDRRAQYAIFERGPSGWEVEFRQVPYDLGRTFAVYESSGFLAHGGVTAQLLRMELEHAAPFLVPFLEWCRARELPATMEHVRQYLALRQDR
jgi:diadenosine tetraphosphatase ApaH/serine/threonine PP2A family protein phosphatase